MSDTKPTYPLPALLVFPFVPEKPAGQRRDYWDQVRIRAVSVIAVRADGKALVEFRVGSHTVREIHPVANLASTPEKALALLTPQFVSLLAVPALVAIGEAVAATEGAS